MEKRRSEAHGIAEERAQFRRERRKVDEIEVGAAPLEQARRGPGRRPLLPAAARPEPLNFRTVIEVCREPRAAIRQLLGAERVLDDNVAVKIKEVLLLLSEAAGGGIPVRGRTAVRLISLATAAAGRARSGTAHISGARHSPLAVAVQCYMLRVYVSRLRVCGSHFRFLNDELPRL